MSVLIFLVTGVCWVAGRALLGSVGRADVLGDVPAGAGADQNVLLVGLDSRTDAEGDPLPAGVLAALHAGDSSAGGDNTDTMMVVHIPAGGGAVSGYSIPRDSFVDIPGYGTHKINSAYTFGENAARVALRDQGLAPATLAVRAAAAGAQAAIAAVDALTGLTIDHYAAVNLAGFSDISAAVGGVPVCLDAPVDDDFSGAHFPAGPQTVTGAQALAFVRQRHGLPGGDLDRERRQQAFVTSMAHTILAAHTLTDPDALSSLLGALQRDVVLDQQWDLTTLTAQLSSLSAADISFQTIPVVTDDLSTPEDGQAVEVDPATVAAYIAATDRAATDRAASDRAASDRAASDHTGPPAPATTPLTPAPLDGATALVDVRNASTAAGAATVAMTALHARGFRPGTVGNTHAASASTITYPPGDAAVAQRANLALGGGFTLVTNDTATHLLVVLGSAPRRGPPASAASGAPAPVITGASVPCVN